ncbi:MAG TPA: HAD family hydrolase [Spirochaetales bacterium]|nr:HAD family hydrolase [Spirochaetales bacterium]
MAEIKAIIFDQDGVIIDTERDGHRVAFNKTFKEFGFDFEWDVDYYYELLQVAGGKERMRHHLHTKGFGKEIIPAEEDELIKKLHRRKTEIFIELIKEGSLPLRPGIKRIMKEAMARGLKIGICTTANEKAAHAVAYEILKEVKFDFVLAGDVVKKKKPDPEVYLLGLKTGNLKAEECIVFEDSKNGIAAAKAAGMNVVVTTNRYTEKEDLSKGDIIVTCLGDPEGEKGELIKGGRGIDYNGVLWLDQLTAYFAGISS